LLASIVAGSNHRNHRGSRGGESRLLLIEGEVEASI
jgi:hypothetical protein